jgi:hypothetical protein
VEGSMKVKERWRRRRKTKAEVGDLVIPVEHGIDHFRVEKV